MTLTAERLRAATRSQNKSNERRRQSNSTGFKGVSKRGPGKYRAMICKDYKQYRLGQFPTARAAHKAYVAAARRLFGKFARSR